MVMKGTVSVELIDATTKQAFLEHTASDGDTYVEVEPEAEYFIRVANNGKNTVAAEFYVDKEELGYYDMLSPLEKSYNGLWYFNNGESTDVALTFSKVPVRAEQASGNEDFPWGEVRVVIYEAIANGVENRKKFESKWKPNYDNFASSLATGKQLIKEEKLRSKAGNLSTKEFEGKKINRFSRGGHLCTITLKYGTAVGLINAGILPRPPLWDLHRMQHPAKDMQENVPKITPTMIEVEDSTGSMEVTKKCEFFDMTVLSDSESEDESVED